MVTLLRRNGTYYAKYLYGGKEVRASLRTKNKVEAERLRKKIIEELRRNPNPAAPQPRIVRTVGDLMDLYAEHVEEYYKAGNRLKSVRTVVYRMKPYANTPITEFGPKQLGAVLHDFAQTLARSSCNMYLSIIKLAFKWGVVNEYVPPTLYGALALVSALRAGRSAARETDGVKPVSIEHVEATKKHLPPVLAAAIELQLQTAARPGEILGLRVQDIDRSGEVWKAELKHHKNAHRGKSRTLYFGEASKNILRELMIGKGQEDYLISPGMAMTQRGRNTQKNFKERYSTLSYWRVITTACSAAGIPAWHPNQLRHTRATMLRAQYGAEAARLFLGHSSLNTTEIYAEIDRSKLEAMAKEIG